MQPDLQSFNTLMDVFAKMGDWERAWSVMGAIRRAAVAPDTWSHNTLISACARCVARLSRALPDFSHPHRHCVPFADHRRSMALQSNASLRADNPQKSLP